VTVWHGGAYSRLGRRPPVVVRALFWRLR
jgi:hypothetical protein